MARSQTNIGADYARRSRLLIRNGLQNSEDWATLVGGPSDTMVIAHRVGGSLVGRDEHRVEVVGLRRLEPMEMSEYELGTQLPLLLKFARPPVRTPPRLRYDAVRKMNMLAGGFVPAVLGDVDVKTVPPGPGEE